jgi:hypothetical protein
MASPRPLSTPPIRPPGLGCSAEIGEPHLLAQHAQRGADVRKRRAQLHARQPLEFRARGDDPWRILGKMFAQPARSRLQARAVARRIAQQRRQTRRAQLQAQVFMQEELLFRRELRADGGVVATDHDQAPQLVPDQPRQTRPVGRDGLLRGRGILCSSRRAHLRILQGQPGDLSRQGVQGQRDTGEVGQGYGPQGRQFVCDLFAHRIETGIGQALQALIGALQGGGGRGDILLELHALVGDDEQILHLRQYPIVLAAAQLGPQQRQCVFQSRLGGDELTLLVFEAAAASLGRGEIAVEAVLETLQPLIERLIPGCRSDRGPAAARRPDAAPRARRNSRRPRCPARSTAR